MAQVEGLSPGDWCIAVEKMDAESLVLTVSLVAEGEITTEEPGVPAVRWNPQAPDCGAGQVEVETLVYVNGLAEPRPLSFSLTGEDTSTPSPQSG